jgi:uncharacterized protein YbbK (DUF523 family)
VPAVLRLGISACLLGRAVRFDGGHRHDPFLTDMLGRFVEWVPVCPEVEIGMGVPREPVQLVRVGGAIRLVGRETGRDHTRAMRAWARRRVRELAGLRLAGYVLKSRSPSCGLARVPVRNGGRRAAAHRGLFADELLHHLTTLPVEEERRLGDHSRRAHFFERALAYGRLRDLLAGRWTRPDLVAFHAAHDRQLRAHSPTAARALARLVGSTRLGRRRLAARYEAGFMRALARPRVGRQRPDLLGMLRDA